MAPSSPISTSDAISPGQIATTRHDKLGTGEVAALVRQISAGRRGDPNEITQAAVFLASDESSFNVGSKLVIDGV